MKKLTKEQRYAKVMKDKGFTKMCIWVHPKDKEWLSAFGRLSRGEKE